MTPQEVKKSYDRLRKDAKGLRLKFIKEVALKMYQGCQNAKLN